MPIDAQFIPKDQIIRLMREKWPNAQMLAEEIFSILNTWRTDGFDFPLIVNADGEQPAITVRNRGDEGDIALSIERAGEDVGGISIELDGDGEPVATLDGNVSGESGSSQTSETAERHAFTGTVQSGSGSSYQVLLDDGTTQAVTQLQIDAAETIPAGTRAVVVKNSSGVYQMQVPIWLD